ncbi:MAG: hydantoinase/oxoprolinase family protein [Candidatus Ranarchaeia archaeon]
MKRVIGFDIGGANIKAADLRIQGKQVKTKVSCLYFPFWKKNRAELRQVLRDIVCGREPFIDCVNITITAELSDAYITKAEGIEEIVTAVQSAFPGSNISVLTNEGTLVSPSVAKNKPMSVAASNWMATGWLVSKKVDTGIIIDTGSTSTSVIPLLDGQVVARGKTDLKKLQLGELVYTGALRTTIPAIVNSIPVKGQMTPVSAEWFSQSGDIHLILGHIRPKEYTVDTPDGRGVSKHDAFVRLARVVCADITMINRKELIKMAKYVYDMQLEQIHKGVKQVFSDLCNLIEMRRETKKPRFITAGLGRDFLGSKVAQRFGANGICGLESLFGLEAAFCAPAYGAATMAINKED